MEPLYGEDLAYIQAAAFGGLARGAAPEIIRLLRSAAAPIRSVVDLGCGAGVLAAALVEAGFQVAAVDDSTDLLETTAKAAPRARLVKASIYDVEIPECQAIVAIGEPLTYHDDSEEADARLERFFRRAAAVLPAGGMLIFDIIETGEPSLTGRFWTSGADWAVLADTTEDQTSRTLVRTIETFRAVGGLYRRGREVHRIRLFETSRLTSQLVSLGFLVKTAQAYGAERLPPRRRAFLCSRL